MKKAKFKDRPENSIGVNEIKNIIEEEYEKLLQERPGNITVSSNVYDRLERLIEDLLRKIS